MSGQIRRTLSGTVRLKIARRIIIYAAAECQAPVARLATPAGSGDRGNIRQRADDEEPLPNPGMPTGWKPAPHGVWSGLMRMAIRAHLRYRELT
jgi:hypothetical protein